MRFLAIALIASLGFASPAAAQTFSSGDWAASKIGQVCYVFTTRAASDTSGALVFRFENKGYNAGFSYEYAPWPGETGAPWGENDYVALEVDEEVTWLSDEMSTDLGPTGYNASWNVSLMVKPCFTACFPSPVSPRAWPRLVRCANSAPAPCPPAKQLKLARPENGAALFRPPRHCKT
jgi:hypothetical protein